MPEPGSKRGRGRDAEKTRETILDTAEAAFAEHGFDGARIDAIARASGYNISLLFQYFGDKLGLYVAVLKRADRELNSLLAGVLTPWLAGETLTSQAQGFRSFLETLVRMTFDHLVAHPRFLRILTWEMAEGWQTYAQIASQFSTEESGQFETLFQEAQSAGLLRSDFSPMIETDQLIAPLLPYKLQLINGTDLKKRLPPHRQCTSDRAAPGGRESVHDRTLAVGIRQTARSHPPVRMGFCGL